MNNTATARLHHSIAGQVAGTRLAKNQNQFRWPLGWALLLLPLGDLCSGAQYYITGVDSTINSARIVKGVAIIVALMCWRSENWRTTEMRVLLQGSILSGMLAVINGVIHGGIERNALWFLQCHGIACATAIIVSSGSRSESRQLVSVFMWGSWACVVGSLLLCQLFGVGIEHYQGMGSKGLYRAGNEAMFTLVGSFCVILPSLARSFFYRCAVTALTAIAALVLAGKTAIAGMCLVIVYVLARALGVSHRLLIVGMIASVIVTVLYYDAIFLQYVKYSSQRDRYEYFLSQGDVLSVLLSHRDRIVEDGLMVVGGFSLVEWITGRGIEAFQADLAAADVAGHQKLHRYAEMDWLDLLGIGGLCALIWFYGLLCFISLSAVDKHWVNISSAGAFGILAILVSLLAGHVGMSASAMAMVGVVFGSVVRERR